MTAPRARPAPPGSHITAILGPTNTGKTHLAIERMLGHKSGMIGQPLRLLAREVYERIRARVSPSEVALMTGEEKIIPPQARYFVCTTESMPWDRDVDFLAVDEIQLAADPDRGHIFTDRLLRARGGEETMFLGSKTARPLIKKLLPDAEITTRPRLSILSHSGHRKLTKLPRRTAIVDFSADRVYAIAELIRRQRGGAAVVMGALSPRTRNAQVALYQNGDVDYLIATDAIGMGLNMDVDHVAFASTSKFDGSRHRPLKVAELAQIAGRAGRHMNDGTFGTTGEARPLTPETIERIEDHRFEADPVFHWRNSDIDFSTLKDLIASLEQPPGRDGLARAPMAIDLEAVILLSRNEDIQRIAAAPAAIGLLWEVAQIPDFRKTMISEHTDLIARVYRSLMADEGRISQDWLDQQVTRLDRVEGDIDTLSNRIAHMRTWTYIANRSGWLDDAPHWQERTRAVEDRLSDALHERLTQRFVDRRTSVLMKRLREREDLMASISEDGDVLVEGEFVGKLQGFVFVADPRAEGIHEKALRAASDKALAGEIIARAGKIAMAPASDIQISEQGHFIWQGHIVGHLASGDTPLAPKVTVLASEQLNGPERDKVVERLQSWIRVHIATVLEPLEQLRAGEELTGLAKGVAFQLVENLGSMNREQIAEDVRALDQEARGQLRKKGVRFGAHSIFVPALLKPAPARLILILWTLNRPLDDQNTNPFDNMPTPPAPGLTSVTVDPAASKEFYEAIGFRVCGPRAVRRDMLERLADVIRPIITERRYKGGVLIDPDMMSIMGCSAEEMAGILGGLGYRKAVEKFSSEEIAQAERLTAVAKAPKTIAATTAHVPAAPTPPTTEASKEPAKDSQTDEAKDLAAQATTPPASPDAPDATAAATPEAPTTSGEPATEQAVEQTATPAPAASPETSTTETAAAETVKTESTETTAEDQTPAVAVAEPIELEIWRPQRRHSHKGPGRSPRQQGKSDRSDKAKRGKSGPSKGPRKQNASKGSDNHRSRPPKREKPMDPDSPFAALAALKNLTPKK
ncbi:MAG: disulfide oxidoreductase [Rhodobiaceae bacterium]|nr:MAG: disulfide oxidoreductase [Rhodobiaceae bacterium]